MLYTVRCTPYAVSCTFFSRIVFNDNGLVLSASPSYNIMFVLITFVLFHKNEDFENGNHLQLNSLCIGV